MKTEYTIIITSVLICLSLLFVGAAKAETIYLNPSQCMNLTLWNITSNTTYVETVCSNATITYNETCSINATIGCNETYQNSTGACNVTIRGTGAGYYCPACPKESLCEIDETFYPKLDNTTFYENTNGTCRVNFRVAECKPCSILNIPENYTAVPDSELERYGRMIDLYSECNEKLMDHNTTIVELEKIKVDYCPIDDWTLLNGWEKLGKYEKSYLNEFIKATTPIDYIMFSDMIAPEATGNEKLNYDFYAGLALGSYEKVGFAEPVCETYLDERLMRNTTICFYMPVINEACINKTTNLDGIKKLGWWGGFQTLGIWETCLVIAFFATLFITARFPLFPPI